MLALAAFFCSAFVLFGADYYVATTGNDTTGDGSQSNAWATVTKAKTVAVAGDTVHVASGHYAERVTLSKSGAVGRPISFIGPSDRSATNYGFYLNGANYVTVGWFSCSNNAVASTAYNWDDSGISNRGHDNTIVSNDCYLNPLCGIFSYNSGASSPSNCVFQGNRCWSNVLTGLYIFGSTNSVIRWNEIWGTMNTNSKNAYAKGDADGIQPFGDGMLIESNYIHGLWWHTNDPYNSGAGVHVDGIQTWVDSGGRNALRWSTVRGNILDLPDIGGNCFMWQGCTNVYIYNNVFRSHRPVITTANGATYPGRNFFYNNTFIVKKNDEVQTAVGNPFAIITGYMQTAEFTNNLFMSDVGVQFIINNYTRTNITGGVNLFYCATGAVPNCDSYTFAASDIRNRDPKMSSAFGASLDSSIASDSAAKDAGIAISQFSDGLYSTIRPQGSAWDIGAYEYVTGLPGTPVPSPAPPARLRVFDGP